MSQIAIGVWWHAPTRKFFKWCNLVRFGENFVKKIVKIFNFLIKIIDNVLLRTIFKGVGA